MTVEKKIQPRGIRNNNPLNIRIGNTWLGEVKDNTDGYFEQFVSMVYGVRAAFVLLRRYISHYHFTSIEDIISRWAPASENATTKYIDQVYAITKFNRFDTMKYDEDMMVRLVDAMIVVECGQHIDINIIKQAFAIA